MAKGNWTYCKTCKEKVVLEYCELCNNIGLDDSCLACHKELIHGITEDQNIHICGGGRPNKLDTPDYDPDAFGRSD